MSSLTDRHFALLRLGKANSQRDEARKELEHERKQRAIADADYLAEAERCRKARAEVERWERRREALLETIRDRDEDLERLRGALECAVQHLEAASDALAVADTPLGMVAMCVTLRSKLREDMHTFLVQARAALTPAEKP